MQRRVHLQAVRVVKGLIQPYENAVCGIVPKPGDKTMSPGDATCPQCLSVWRTATGRTFNA